MYTLEQRQQASDRAKARWSDPVYKESQSLSIRKPANCPDCGEKDIAKFYCDKNGNRKFSRCKDCQKLVFKERWHSRDCLDRWASRNHKYNVSKEYLISLYEKQQNKCAICNQEPSTKRGLHVDHCHKTGKVRGLLCHGCNVSLGNFKDDVSLLNNAIEYLRNN